MYSQIIDCQVALVWLPLVQYYTGQLFDISSISPKVHEIGALLGLDMAHGIGNVECKLNEWNIDFAVWCTYKYVQITASGLYLTLCFRYLNAGPGAIGGFYIRSGLEDGGRRYVQVFLKSVLLSDTLLVLLAGGAMMLSRASTCPLTSNPHQVLKDISILARLYSHLSLC